METGAALEVIARADAQLPDFNDPTVPVEDEAFASAAEALGARLHPRYEALLRTVGGGEDNAIWAPPTVRELWAPRPQLGRGLMNAAREAWRGYLRTSFRSPLTSSATTTHYVARMVSGVPRCGYSTMKWRGNLGWCTQTFSTG